MITLLYIYLLIGSTIGVMLVLCLDKITIATFDLPARMLIPLAVVFLCLAWPYTCYRVYHTANRKDRQ